MTFPPATDDRVSRRMKRTRGRDNDLERALRSALHRLGLRFRLHRKLLPGSTRTADVVFPKQRVAVFVDGCFWHGCPIHGTWPKRNAEWWRAKIEANMQRDRDTDARLAGLGWRVVRVWEHETPDEAASRVASAVRTEPVNPSEGTPPRDPAAGPRRSEAIVRIR